MNGGGDSTLPSLKWGPAGFPHPEAPRLACVLCGTGVHGHPADFVPRSPGDQWGQAGESRWLWGPAGRGERSQEGAFHRPQLSRVRTPACRVAEGGEQQAEDSLWGRRVPVLRGLCWVTAVQAVPGRLLSWGAGRGDPRCEDSGE